MKALIALVAALGLTTSAMAAEPATPASHSWSGVYIGGHAGLDLTTNALTLGPFGLDSLATTGTAFGVHGGFDFQIPHSPLVIGLGGDYTWSNTTFSVSPGLLEASLDESWAIYGRLGLDVGRAMPYVMAGWTRANVSGAIPVIPASASDSMDGWLAGGGVDISLGSGFIVGAEYRYTKFNGLDIGPLGVDTERHEVRAKLSYKFNPF